MTTREENIRLIFGLKVRQLRMERSLTLDNFAKASGISISYLNEIEKGKKYPKANKIAQIAKALDVSYDWLVSMQLSRNLRPISELVKSDLLTNLPLEIFGIEPSDLLNVLSNTPSKISAFISTLIELARNYNIGVENFYFSVLRSYQEMHENYFEDLEDVVAKFREEYPQFQSLDFGPQALVDILVQKYNYKIDESSLNRYADLQNLRSVFIPGSPKKLLLNEDLDERQKMFSLAREIGYNYMKLKERAYTSSWIKIQSFEQLLNNFKASYFSGSLLIPQQSIIEDIGAFIKLEKWDEMRFMEILHKYRASPEMLIHRLTNIMPRFFGLNQLFFLRFNHKRGQTRYVLNKELHLAGLYNPHSTMLHEHYCRRWVSLHILQNESLSSISPLREYPAVSDIQRSQYIDSDNEFLCISLARPINPTPNTNSSVTLGFLITEDLKKQIKFWDDPAIPVKRVGVTCERCSDMNCQERVAFPSIHLKEEQTQQIQDSLDKLIKDQTGA